MHIVNHSSSKHYFAIFKPKWKRHTSKPGPDSDSKKTRTKRKPGLGLEKIRIRLREKPDSPLEKPDSKLRKTGSETAFRILQHLDFSQRFKNMHPMKA